MRQRLQSEGPATFREKNVSSKRSATNLGILSIDIGWILCPIVLSSFASLLFGFYIVSWDIFTVNQVFLCLRVSMLLHVDGMWFVLMLSAAIFDSMNNGHRWFEQCWAKCSVVAPLCTRYSGWGGTIWKQKSHFGEKRIPKETT